MTGLKDVGYGALDTKELEVRLVPDYCELATFGAGDELRHKGIHYSNMYLIVRGRVDVVLDGQPAPVAMGPGSPVGEIGFMKGCPATVTATAREHTTVLVLDDPTLWRIEREEPGLSISLLRAIAHTAQYRLDRDASLGVEQAVEAASGIEVLLCRDDAMLEQAMRLRYRVYCEELGRSSPYADHERKLIRDNLDDSGYTFIAADGGKAIGTLRANFAADSDLGTLEQLYGLAESPHHPQRTLLCTKLIVEKSRRGGSACMELIRAVAAYVVNAGRDIRECYIDCIPALIPLYKRIGFRPTAEIFYHYENGPSVPMVMDLDQYSKTLAKRLQR